MAPSSRIRVLLVEDDVIDQRAFQRAVEQRQLPYDYTLAGSVAEARRQIHTAEFDVIILDYILGDGTAFDVLAEKPKTPVVITTARGDEAVAAEAIKAGAWDYFVKDKNHDYLTILPHTVSAAIARQQADQQIRMLSHAVRSIRDSLHITDLNDTITFVNDAFLETFGYDEGAILGRHNLELSPVKPNGNDLPPWGSTTPGRDPRWRGECGYRHREGRVVPVWMSRSLVEDDDGRPFAIARVIRDLSQQKDLERKVRKLQREHEAFMRHELNNMIAPIKLNVDVLCSEYLGDLDQNQRDVLDRIQLSLVRLADLIGSLKQLQDFEQDQMSLRTRPAPIAPILQQVCGDLSTLAAQHRVTVETVDRIGAPATVGADHTFLPGVFHNLLKNAIEHVGDLAEESEKVVRLDVSRDDHTVTITVNNRGPVITPEKLAMFFEKFNSDRNAKVQGTGLGTTYASLVTRAHGGTIAVESNPTDGTTVTVRLPALPSMDG